MMSDEDIAELKNITDYIEEKDPQEKPGYMVVKNDLKDPVKYSDREDIKEFYFYLINLDEIIVIYNR